IFSGGVAANSFLRSAVQHLANENDLHFSAPPQRLCTDNGVMIAWNGALLHARGLRIVHDTQSIDYSPVYVFTTHSGFLPISSLAT
ncbi:putative tRNA N6-adenosine threonylcarbamoyltransferase, mitochondrial, partial [Cichlidogyrus casuarinus]